MNELSFARHRHAPELLLEQEIANREIHARKNQGHASPRSILTANISCLDCATTDNNIVCRTMLVHGTVHGLTATRVATALQHSDLPVKSVNEITLAHSVLLQCGTRRCRSKSQYDCSSRGGHRCLRLDVRYQRIQTPQSTPIDRYIQPGSEPRYDRCPSTHSHLISGSKKGWVRGRGGGGRGRGGSGEFCRGSNEVWCNY